MSEPKQCCGRRHLSYNVMGTGICPRTRILTETYDNRYGPRRKLMSSTVRDVGPLRRLLPIGSRLGTLVRRAARQSGMGRDHLPSEARAWSFLDQRTCHPWHRLPCQQGRLKGKGRPGTFEGPSLPLVFFLFKASRPLVGLRRLMTIHDYYG